eukprot:INCI14510.2.p2 GENE.INCI14510.2~~INCI14510.2.p2  ORF type:complete len:232 (+),score=18.21 INCI14510.2:172-867(+)
MKGAAIFLIGSKRVTHLGQKPLSNVTKTIQCTTGGEAAVHHVDRPEAWLGSQEHDHVHQKDGPARAGADHREAVEGHHENRDHQGFLRNQGAFLVAHRHAQVWDDPAPGVLGSHRPAGSHDHRHEPQNPGVQVELAAIDDLGRGQYHAGQKNGYGFDAVEADCRWEIRAGRGNVRRQPRGEGDIFRVEATRVVQVDVEGTLNGMNGVVQVVYYRLILCDPWRQGSRRDAHA